MSLVNGAAAIAATPAGARAREAHITIRGLAKRFQGAVIYDGFDFDIPRGEFLSIFGPNGCGKSTLINIVAGLIPADAGTILFGGKTLKETKIGYVFQNYREALFPWLRSIDNIEYPLKLARLPKGERGGPADRAGLRAGDVVVDVEGRPTPNTPALLAGIARIAPGASARVTVVRDGKPQVVEVVAGRWPKAG